MAGYTRKNLKTDVEDIAPKHGMAPDVEAHFATGALELEQTGISYQRLEPNKRLPFGHKHERQEEIYVVLSGSGRMKIDDDVIELREFDAVRVSPEMMRAIESGEHGIEILAYGAPRNGSAAQDAEMVPNWWTD